MDPLASRTRFSWLIQYWSTQAWDVGAVGAERLGGRLTGLAGEDMRVLHDRRIPGSRTATGIWVIDAKKYKGRPQLKVEGGVILVGTEKLLAWLPGLHQAGGRNAEAGPGRQGGYDYQGPRAPGIVFRRSGLAAHR